MASTTITANTLTFLKVLAKNNNREWFAKNKPRYQLAHENMIAFAHALLIAMEKHDNLENATGKESLHRIYRDIRFSKDKTPYNTHFGGGFRRATKKLRGGYYFHIEPGNSFVAGGFWGPNTDDMKRIREDIDANHEDWRKLLNNKMFVKTFGNLKGEQLSTAPRGYAKDHPAIDLLRYKQYLVVHTFTDEEVLADSFVSNANNVFKSMRPFLNYMSEVLTTDANGEPLF
jgi:uncharacterized protein (TIGR02453 family)